MFLLVIPIFFRFSMASGGAVVVEKALLSRGVLKSDSLVFNMKLGFKIQGRYLIIKESPLSEILNLTFTAIILIFVYRGFGAL